MAKEITKWEPIDYEDELEDVSDTSLDELYPYSPRISFEPTSPQGILEWPTRSPDIYPFGQGYGPLPSTSPPIPMELIQQYQYYTPNAISTELIEPQQHISPTPYPPNAPDTSSYNVSLGQYVFDDFEFDEVQPSNEQLDEIHLFFAEALQPIANAQAYYEDISRRRSIITIRDSFEHPTWTTVQRNWALRRTYDPNGATINFPNQQPTLHGRLSFNRLDVEYLLKRIF